MHFYFFTADMILSYNVLEYVLNKLHEAKKAIMFLSLLLDRNLEGEIDAICAKTSETSKTFHPNDIVALFMENCNKKNF